MAQNNTNQTMEQPMTLWQEYIDTEALINVCETWVVFGVSLLQLCILLKLIWNERIKPTLLAFFKASLTRFNVMLFSMILIMFLVSLPLDSTQIWFNTYSNLLISGFHILALYYSWFRGIPVIDVLMPMVRPYVFAWLVVYSILLAIIDALIIVIDFSLNSEFQDIMKNYLGYLDVVSGFLAFGFEAFVVGVYGYYLWRMKEQDFGVNTSRERIICIYGAIGTLFIFLLQLSIILVVNWTQLEVPTVSVELLTIVLSVQAFSPTAYLFVQLAMKRALFVNKKNAPALNQGSDKAATNQKSIKAL
ncbi:hypothetical protein BCR33DRAFT_168981 [Rhizoclosmatium globosum]|uniref:THH1/TOM1/TOM3 domain-containing protein n=1 Tax=Rhizoclosmatium globosum TaxID=329046 RepID=A0A1Y2CEI9_9FUNG|nr:hypothetical protein BCR33DRAFT_168981 [Rhizoclosmatium globosum]|eukprot:ORY45471.1 hypothetical protein BCR33DRAFT_168981 [Rhizoclosmatium globosum]